MKKIHHIARFSEMKTTKAKNQFEAQFYEDTQKFIDNMLNKYGLSWGGEKLVKYFAILQAVNNKLKAKFPEIKILAESDVEEKIIRPSFMTMLDNIEHEDFMNVGVDKSVKLRIYYFSTNVLIY